MKHEPIEQDDFDDEMNEEQEPSQIINPIRGKYYQALQQGYTITIYKTDGTTELRQIPPAAGVIVLAPDVQRYFPDSEAVNRTLRRLIELIPQQSLTTEAQPDPTHNRSGLQPIQRGYTKGKRNEPNS